MPLLTVFTDLSRLRSASEDRPGLIRRAFSKTQSLKLPLRFSGPIALLAPGFRLKRGMRQFDPCEEARIQMFGPHLIVAPLHAALTLADRKLRGLIDFPDLQFALIVLTSAEGEPLLEHHRDLLWKAFGVPVFEQLCDPEGRVIARECEVHDGLHVAQSQIDGKEMLFSKYEIVTGQCECGAETSRLRVLAPVPKKAAAAAA